MCLVWIVSFEKKFNFFHNNKDHSKHFGIPLSLLRRLSLWLLFVLLSDTLKASQNGGP